MSKSIHKEIGQLIIAGFRGNAISKDSDIVKYIKDFHQKQIVEVIEKKHVIYQYVFYFCYGFVVWSHMFFELVIKLIAGLVIYFADQVEYLTSFL